MDLPISLLEKSIQRGTILHSTMFENINHGKFFVVMGVTQEYIAGFFFINSNIHRSLSNKPDQFALQYPLRHADYKFLKYDSFLCATDILKKKRKEIAESITDGETSIVGILNKEHLDEVLDMVRNSKLFSKIDKMKFFYN